MSHPFGDLIAQHLHRKHGLSQAKLAEGILQDPSIIGKMCKGKRLNGPQARERVCAIIAWLHQQAALTTLDEANGLLAAAGMAAVRKAEPTEAQLLQQLNVHSPAPTLPTLPPVPVTTKPRTNLPAALTSFVGRAEAVTEVTQLIATHRLVTLTGAGGVGKTRLALETARTFVESWEPASALFPDGIWLVELAAFGATDMGTTMVTQALVQRFKLTEQDSRSTLETLNEYFANKHLLLVLDNCEHLVDGCAEVCATLLQHCWQLHILTTSREELRIPGEVLYPVPPLTLPAPTVNDSSDVLACASAQLFVDRLHSTQPGLTIQPNDIAQLAHICRQLDGIPLALELAAPLARTLALAEIAKQLDNQMALLTNRYRTTIPRHQTMYSALAWSYHLLAPEEQQLLARASVFAGGWSLEAAQAVCADSASADTQTDVAMLLQQLNDKSWVLIETVNEQRRYRLLEPVRQFAAQQLVGNQIVQQQIQRQHSRYYLRLLGEQEEPLQSQQQGTALAIIRNDFTNISNAWQWAVDQQKFELLAPAIHNLFLYCDVRSAYREGIILFAHASAKLAESVAANPADGPDSHHLYGQILLRLGACEMELGNYQRAVRYLQDGLQHNRRDPEQAFALEYLGMAAIDQGELTLAQTHLSESLAIHQRDNDWAGMAHVLFKLSKGLPDYAQAIERASESLMLWRKVGRLDQIAHVLGFLGFYQYCFGDYAQAKANWQEGLALCQQLELQNERAWVLDCIGYAAWGWGEMVVAEQSLREALAIYTEVGSQGMMGMAKAELALVLASVGRTEQAIVLVQEATAIMRAINMQMHLTDGLSYLGAVLVLAGDFVAARSTLLEAIQMAWKNHYIFFLMMAFYFFADLLVRESRVMDLPDAVDRQALALTLLSYVRTQSFTWQIYKDKAAQLQAQIEPALPANLCTTAIARGQNASVAEMVTILLAVV